MQRQLTVNIIVVMGVSDLEVCFAARGHINKTVLSPNDHAILVAHDHVVLNDDLYITVFAVLRAAIELFRL
ncbi:hypothetical protein JE959_000113 [Aeromonas veronii]|nr:hypothetical protein [Aeromonas veronii]